MCTLIPGLLPRPVNNFMTLECPMEKGLEEFGHTDDIMSNYALQKFICDRPWEKGPFDARKKFMFFMRMGCLGRTLPNDAIGFSVACSVYELCTKLCGEVGENGMRIFTSKDQLLVRNRIRLYEQRAQFRRSELTFKPIHMAFGTVDAFLFYWCLGGQDRCGQPRS